MRNVLALISLVFVIVSCDFGTKDPESLTGMYLTKKNKHLGVVIQVKKENEKFILLIKTPEGKWGNPKEVKPISKDVFEKATEIRPDNTFLALGKDNYFIIKVDKGSKLGMFKSETGYLLLTLMGTIELIKK